MSQKSVDELLIELKHEDPNVRACAAVLLGIRRKVTPKILTALMNATHDPSGMVRFYAIRAFKNMGDYAPLIIPRLIEVLKDSHEDVNVRLAAVDVLGIFREKALPVVPHIISITSIPHVEFRVRMNIALKNICGTSDVEEIQKLISNMSITTTHEKALQASKTETHLTFNRGEQYKLMKAFYGKKRCSKNKKVSSGLKKVM